MPEIPIHGTPEQVLAYCRAMHEMQGEFGSVPKNAVAKVGKGGEREFKFTDYDCLVEYLRPFFAKHGFFHFACAGSTASKTTAVLHSESGVTGEVDSSLASGSVTLAHKGGAMATAFFAMPCVDPRDAGKIITYFRRYLLGSLAGVSSDEDTDAEGVGNPPPQQAQKARQEPPKQQSRAQQAPAPSDREKAQARAEKQMTDLKELLKSRATSEGEAAAFQELVAKHSKDAHGDVPSILARKVEVFKLDEVLRWADENIGKRERSEAGQELDRPDQPGYEDYT